MKPARTRALPILALAAALLLPCQAPPTAVASHAPAAAAPLAAPPKSPVERIVELAHKDSRVQEHLEHLCVDIGPRLTGSTNLQTACEWARDRFASYGLHATLEQWGEFA